MNTLIILKEVSSGIIGAFSKNIFLYTPFVGEYLGRQVALLVTASPFLPAGVALITTLAATWIIQKTDLCKETNHVKRELLSLSVTVLTGAATALISSSLVALLTTASLSLGSTLIVGAFLGATMRIVALLVENLYILFSASGYLNEIKKTLLSGIGSTRLNVRGVDQGFHIENKFLKNLIDLSREEKDIVKNGTTIEGNSLFFTLMPDKKIKAEYIEWTQKYSDVSHRIILYNHSKTKTLKVWDDVLSDNNLCEILKKTSTSEGGYGWPPCHKLVGFHQLLDVVDTEINHLKYLSVFHPVVNKFDKLKARIELMIEKTQHTLAGWDILVNQDKFKSQGSFLTSLYYYKRPDIKSVIQKWDPSFKFYEKQFL